MLRSMEIHVLDNRGLSPPEPMVRILSALTDLAGEDELHATMDREPLLLYAELERRGFAWEFRADYEPAVLRVWRKQP